MFQKHRICTLYIRVVNQWVNVKWLWTYIEFCRLNKRLSTWISVSSTSSPGTEYPAPGFSERILIWGYPSSKVKMGRSNSSCLSTTTILHFHDYGRKRTLSATLWHWEFSGTCAHFVSFVILKAPQQPLQQSHDWRESTNMIEHTSSWAHGCVTLLGVLNLPWLPWHTPYDYDIDSFKL